MIADVMGKGVNYKGKEGSRKHQVAHWRKWSKHMATVWDGLKASKITCSMSPAQLRKEAFGRPRGWVVECS